MGGRGSGSNMGSGTTSMSPAQFDRYVRENGTEVMYRGYSAASQEELEQRTSELLPELIESPGIKLRPPVGVFILLTTRPRLPGM